MIRLNDINKTVIDEKEIKGYVAWKYKDDDITEPYIRIIRIYNTSPFQYETKEARDKDIELLDKLFDTKPIEDKANAYPHEIDVLNYSMSGIKKVSEPAKEEYITWEEVKEGNSLVVRLPNDTTACCTYIPSTDSIAIDYNEENSAFIYNENLFNALRLKKVE